MFYFDDKNENKDETSNYNPGGYNSRKVRTASANYKGVTGTRGKFGYDSSSNYSGYRGESLSNYTNAELDGNFIFSPVSTEESDFKGCGKKCKGELGHGGGFLVFGGGGKTGRKAFRHCNRTCKAAGGAAAMQDQVVTDDLMKSMKMGAGDDDTNPIVWVMVIIILIAIFAGGYMLLKKK